MKGKGEPEAEGQAPLEEGLGMAVRLLRTALDLGRRDLAERAGISYAHLAEIEGNKKRPSTRTLQSIAEALEVPSSELVRLAEAWASSPQEARGSLLRSSSPPPESPSEARAYSGTVPRAWFHGPAEMQDLVRGRAEARVPSPSDEPRRRAAAEELRRLLDRLSPEDVEHLLALARRLAGR